MAKIPDVLVGPLIPLASQVGGMFLLEQLPMDTLFMAVTHSDDVLGVSQLEPNFDFYKLDETLGYAVFDRHYKLLYEELELDEPAWGNTKNDRHWIAQANIGEWAYVRYRTTTGEDRVAMIIRM